MAYDFLDIVDDLKVDPEYKDVDTTPRPPLPGNYLFKVNSWDFAKKFGTDTVVLWNNENKVPTYPLFSLKMIEISDPMEYARKVGLFQDVPTAIQFRDDNKVSQAADLLRAINPEAVAENTGDVIRQLTDSLNSGAEFRARLDYEAYDKTFVDKQLEAQGGKANITDKKALNKIYASGKVRGYKKILQANTSRNNPKLPVYKWAGPSGNIIDVKPVLTIFYPANDSTVRLGPDKAVLTS